MRRIRLRVGGMDCASCARSVERALRSVEGVRDVYTDVVGERVAVTCAAGTPAQGTLVDAVARLGYAVRPVEETGTASGPDGTVESRSEPKSTDRPRSIDRDRAGHSRLLLAGLSGVLWIGSIAVGRLTANEGLAAALAIGAIITGGWHIIPRGIRAAANRALDMNFLMSAAALGALIIGEYGEAASAMFLFAVAQLLEARSMDRARNAIGALLEVAPAEATVIRDGRELRIPVDRLEIGDVVTVKPGEKIPVDGVVVAGRSSVNQAPITGESMPVAKEPASEVFAGTLNGESVLDIRSTKAASDTTLARIIHSVEEARASRAPSQTFVERFARIYTPAVVATALVLMVLPPLIGLGGWGEWFYRALVLLVVACPCALVISTPVTIVSALAGAARRGILIKGGLHLENAGRVTVVGFDKTGTLTRGTPAIVEVAPLDGLASAELLGIAAAAEAGSEHPLARAVMSRARELGIDVPRATDTTTIPGKGVRSTVGADVVYVGGERLFREFGAIPEAVTRMLRLHQADGATPVLVGRADDEAAASGSPVRILGVIAIADLVRDEAGAALRELHAAGIRKVTMITGDNEGAAHSIARILNADGAAIDEIRAGMLPDEKVAAVRELRRNGDMVLFVGDGINDAPALAAADVGVTLGTAGTDVALEVADIALMADDLSKLATTIRIARKAERIIRANIALSLLTKAAFVALAVFGHATLWMAVVADMGASLLVVLNGLRAAA